MSSCVADNIEVAYLKTLTKENIMHFYRVSTAMCPPVNMFDTEGCVVPL